MTRQKTKAAAQAKAQAMTCPLCAAQYLDEHRDALTAPKTDLALDAETGIYGCNTGHKMDIAQLGEAVLALKKMSFERAKNAPETASETGDSDPVSTPIAELQMEAAEEAETLRKSGGEESVGEAIEQLAALEDLSQVLDAGNTALSLVLDKANRDLAELSALESSHSLNDVIYYQNGDVGVRVRVREGLVGPIEELAANDRQTITEWVQDNLDSTLDSYFTTVK